MNKQLKFYISGKITGLADYKEQFAEAEALLTGLGHAVMNPAVLPDGFDYEDYMNICFPMIDPCDGIYMLHNFKDSSGAKRELEYALPRGKFVIYENDRAERNGFDIHNKIVVALNDRYAKIVK